MAEDPLTHTRRMFNAYGVALQQAGKTEKARKLHGSLKLLRWEIDQFGFLCLLCFLRWLYFLF